MRKLLLLLILLAGFIIFLLLNPPSYNALLSRAERLMASSTNFSANYSVYFFSINGSFINGTGSAVFIVNQSSYYWRNSVKIFDVRPDEVVGLMRGGLITEVMNYDSSFPCFTLQGVFNESNVFTKIIACFDKSDGYPLMYSILRTNGVNSSFVSYNSLGYQ